MHSYLQQPLGGLPLCRTLTSYCSIAKASSCNRPACIGLVTTSTAPTLNPSQRHVFDAVIGAFVKD